MKLNVFLVLVIVGLGAALLVNMNKANTTPTATTTLSEGSNINPNDKVWEADVAEYPGIAEIDADGNWSGVGIEMLEAAAAAEGATVAYTHVTLEEGFGRLGKESEILVGFLDKTSDRLKGGNRCVTLTEGSKSLVQAVGSSNTLPSTDNLTGDDLAAEIVGGTKVSVVGASSNRNVAVKLGGQVVSATDNTDALDALVAGNAAFALDDSQRLWKQMQDPKYSDKVEIVGKPFGFVPAGFYVWPGGSKLQSTLELRFTEARENGTFDEAWYAAFGAMGG